ncbi:methyltransferase type 11 protein [Diplodia corticola]|uniref:Methyltransferase type 11 protein n=1 Tax=Diplodia corticola TaxID=236234 RepID=A0A1J9S6R2_9PEZI|nr:methyltransferase type 11 protein [Diplodia corticola]OJD40635.1 methyltransferase type 11 protein [Diplodia corticola]
MSTSATDRFNAEAAAWDTNPVTVRSSELAYEALLRHVPELTHPQSPTTLDILEIGCGTGLLSSHLSPHCRSLLGADLSSGMVAAFNAKVAASAAAAAAMTNASQRPPLSNLAAVETLLERADQPDVQRAAGALLRRVCGRGGDDEPGGPRAPAPVRWGVVVAHLTLHHIPRLGPFLATCLGCLKEGGCVAFTDFADVGPESVLFHPREKREGVERHGIERGEMERLVRGAGFVDVVVEEAFVMEKEVDPSEEEAGGRTVVGFPFLVVVGRKP